MFLSHVMHTMQLYAPIQLSWTQHGSFEAYHGQVVQQCRNARSRTVVAHVSCKAFPLKRYILRPTMRTPISVNASSAMRHACKVRKKGRCAMKL